MKEKHYICESCGGYIEVNQFREFSSCQDCGKIYNDVGIELLDKYGSYEVEEW